MGTRLGSEFRLESKLSDLYADLNAILRANKAAVKDEVERFKQKAAENHLQYAGRALLIAFYPFIVTAAQARSIAGVAESMLGLAERTTRLFLEEESLRQPFGFGPEQLRLIEAHPGYELSIPCARFDSFFDGQSLLFSELNTDGASGMDGADKLPKFLLASPTMQAFFSKYPVRVFDINERVLDTILQCYRQFVGGNGVSSSPRLAIVDWNDVLTSEEFFAFREFCGERGYEAVVADPRELEYNGEVLSHKGLKIDIIYRRVVSLELIERLDEVTAMIEAFVDHNVCMVGSFRSDVAFNKKIFEAMQSGEFARYYSERERRLIHEHVPWTRSFVDAECTYRGRQTNITELARENKDNFVLKPATMYQGRGVKLGVQHTTEQWEDALKACQADDFVLQELLPIPSLPIGVWNDELEMEERLIHLGEFVFGGGFCGFYCRASDVPVVNSHSKELLVPCFVLED